MKRKTRGRGEKKADAPRTCVVAANTSACAKTRPKAGRRTWPWAWCPRQRAGVPLRCRGPRPHIHVAIAVAKCGLQTDRTEYPCNLLPTSRLEYDRLSIPPRSRANGIAKQPGKI